MKSIEIIADGTKYWLSLPDAEQDYIQKTIASTQRPYEEAMLIDMTDCIEPGDLVLDIGANCGNHTLYLACVAGAQVHAFEPDAELCAAISTSVAANCAEGRITVHQVGVGDSDGFGRLVQTAENNRGAQRLELVDEDEQATKIIRLDDLVFDDPVRAIKIDVEGMEFDVLSGAKKLIARDLPELFVECQTRSEFEKIHEFLAQLNYHYLSTFNATPTHRFGHNASADNQDRFEQIVKQQVSATYYDRKLIADLRNSLNQANLKYREVTTLLGQQKEQLRASIASGVHEQEQSAKLQQRLAQNETELANVRLNLDQKNEQILTLEESLRTRSDAARQVSILKEDLAGRAAQIVELRLQLEQKLILARGQEDRLTAGVLAQEKLRVLEQQVATKDVQLLELEASMARSQDELRELETSLAASVRAKEKLVAAANARSAVLSDVRARLSFERSRVKSVDKLMRQISALNLELESRLSEQTKKWSDERQALEMDLKQSENRVRQLRSHAKMLVTKSASARADADSAETQLSMALERLAILDERLLAAGSELTSAHETIAELERKLTVEKGLVARLETSLKDSRKRGQSFEDAAKLSGSQLTDVRAALERSATELSAEQERASLQESKAQVALIEMASLKNELAETKEKLALAEAKTKLLRASVTFRLGQLLRNSLKSPSGFVNLPVALGQLMVENQRRKTTSESMMASASTSLEPNISSVPAAPKGPTNRAAEIRRSRLLPDSRETESLRLETPTSAGKTRVAAIMDEFTVHSFAPECDLLELSLGNYLQELENFAPSLVFLESAWRGKENEWGNKVAQTAAPVREIIEWANSRGVTVVLWNKEDPVHYSTFLNTAKLVDHVFTTDIDCVQKYKSDLGHDRVHFLPFACQPYLHNPLELYQRNSGLCFAGAYYRRYPDRTKDLESFMAKIPQYKTIEIFDRNFGKTDEQYAFPEDYQDYIVGTLSSSEIDLAYKGYDFSVNLNSVKESQSMFARRVYELLASNTTVISNYSRGLELMFGGIPVISDSGNAVVDQLIIASDAYEGRKRRLAGLRKVMSEHTYAHRLAYILNVTGTHESSSLLSSVEVFGLVSREADVHALKESVGRQVGIEAHLRLFTSNLELAERFPEVKPLSELQGLSMSDAVSMGSYIGLMHASDYYGPNYLLDLALAGRYSSASVVGKATHFKLGRNGVTTVGSNLAYTAVKILPMRSSLVLDPNAIEVPLLDCLIDYGSSAYGCPSMLQIEMFDYCRSGAKLKPEHVEAVNGNWSDIGVSLFDLNVIANSISASDVGAGSEHSLTGKDMQQLFVTTSRPGFESWVSDDAWNFESTLEDGKHDYIYAAELLELDSLATGDKLDFHFECDPGLNLQVAIIFYNSGNSKISGMVRAANQNHTLEIPNDAASVKLGLRVFASGSSAIRRIHWQHKNLRPEFVASRAKNVVITNRYPSSEDLYKNGFVHTRVRRYVQAGVPTEVFVLDEGSSLRFREFEGVSVITGNSETLETFLAQGNHQSISIHFVTESMWAAVRQLEHRPNVAIWAHGADIQSWSRRAFLYENTAAVEAAKSASESRMSLWRSIFMDAPDNVKVVFVSDWLHRTALEDLKIDSSKHAVIIHNPINTSRFSYAKKPVEQRLKVLSIRPYASSVYANDLAVDAILLLADDPLFQEMEFRLVGDGPLFDELTRPLEGFENVVLDKRFLTQDEIAEMHREYGVFLCPSRMDTQGVSRDEAMASGLVPVTTSIAAIPEFADGGCAELVGPESPAELAAALLLLARSPRTFKRKSRAAASRVRRQSDASIVIPQELAVLGYGAFSTNR
ncbi:FkbM family methyltransferase [Paenarthrobacter nitroguajacolicus]|uniref:FkbM family methyltransferase n=1 Tax=Paenarthrobacter nitroguajacolicus TaxID=211146 RepID=A0A558GZP9_PAENT|nr:FkbM family methyltransferase [Paenarthrobacter nitroguajacolicus]TVU62360.1 FkbM family methyltransferase [Paenarthrobacter nitroguajacolicus]